MKYLIPSVNHLVPRFTRFLTVSNVLSVATFAVLFYMMLHAIRGFAGTPEEPYLNKFLVKRSPKGTYEATFYNFNDGGGSGFLGATVTRPLYVNVRRRSVPFHPKQGQVLVFRHNYKMRLTWEAENCLRIEHTAGRSDIDKQVSQMDGVTILSGPATSPLPESYKAVSFPYKP